MKACVQTSFYLAIFLCCFQSSCQGSADTVKEVPLWRYLELSFEAEPGEPHPLSVDFRVFFRGPRQMPRIVPGFWDGGSTWKARLTPDVMGEWTWWTECSDLPELDGLSGSFTAIPAEGGTMTGRHGGFLKVSPNKRYLTYSDGTPFFWLADTIWTFPTDATPLQPDGETGISMLGTILEKRREQGFTVLQCGFIQGKTGNLDRNDPLTWKSEDMDFWHRADERILAAVDAGFTIAMTSNWSKQVHDYPLEAMMLKWRHLVARYAALPVVWIVSGEYNIRSFGEETVDKVMVLGTYIKKLDPYKRAMSVHPWAIQFDDRQAWDAEWNDFILLQGGHRLAPSAFSYLEAYMRPDPKPVLESECDYEGMFEYKSKADLVRHVAYRSIQNGSFGFTYGALGMWNAHPEPADPGKWGLPTRWEDALAFEGGRQMCHLKSVYESVDWWKLEPRPISASPNEHARVHVKAIENEVFVVYFEAGLDPELSMTISPKPGTGRFWGNCNGEWFNPRTGEHAFLEYDAKLKHNWAANLILPPRPNNQDWVLIVRKLDPGR